MSGRLLVPPGKSLSGPFICSGCRLKLRRATLDQRRWIGMKQIQKEKDGAIEWAKQAEEIKAGKKKNFLSLLEERGLVQSVVGDREALDHLLTEKRTGAYVGIDPTAPSLHIGHMVTLMPLFWMFAHGYKAFTLLGGTTSRIGDPSGRTTSRPLLTSAERKSNIAEMHMQLKKLWVTAEKHIFRRGYEREYMWRRGLVNNSSWWNSKTMLEVMRDLGAGVRIGPMLGRDNVKTRLESGDGMSFAEFTYPLMQTWDWWELYQQQGIQIQVGGSDQFGNILSGVEGIKYMNRTHHSPVLQRTKPDPLLDPIGITVPLLTTASGEKFGKSAGNAIWISPERTNTFELYQYFLRLPDSEVERLLKMLTFLPLPTIARIMSEHQESPEKRYAQHTLAREFVELVHGFEASKNAAAEHRLVFSGKLPLPQSTQDSAQDGKQPTTALNMPSHHVTLPLSAITSEPIARIIVFAGLAVSRSESNRLIANKGVHIGARSDGTAMSDDLTFIPVNNWKVEDNAKYIIDGNLFILRVGKWKLKIIKLVSDEEFEKESLIVPGLNPEPDVPKTPEELEEKEAKNENAKIAAKNFAEHSKKVLEALKKKGYVGPGLSPSDMRARRAFDKQEEREKTAKKIEKRAAMAGEAVWKPPVKRDLGKDKAFLGQWKK